MFGTRRVFESEVHLGLLLIVCLLLLLSGVSNYVLYRARNLQSEVAFTQFKTASLAASRVVQSNSPPALPDADAEAFRLKYHLSELRLITTRPEDSTPITRGHWLSAVVHDLPPEDLRSLAVKLMAANYRTITRGVESEYFFIEPISSGSGRMLLILSQNLPWLAFLDDWGQTILIVSLVAILVLSTVYVGVSRVIFSPFRKIRATAALAGRDVNKQDSVADGVVEEYRRVIDELREKEAELLRLNAAVENRAESLEQFNDFLLMSMETGLVTLDLEGKILTINDAAKRIFGITSEGETPRDFRSLLRELPDLSEWVTDALTAREARPYQELEWMDRQHNASTMGVTISQVRDAEQLTVGISLLISDLTEISRLRSNLEKQNRLAALGEMSAGLAHQLRNSMGAISGYGTLIRKKLQASGLDVDSIQKLLDETREAEDLVGRFLGFARPMAFEPEQVKLGRFLSELIGSLRVREDCRQIEFELHRESNSDCAVELDPLLMKQAVSNLIENGVNAYRGKPGSIEIFYGSVGDEAFITVTDHGCGIPEGDKERVFTPFYSSRPAGTGLGLPLASRIVSLHRGSLALLTDHAAGTRFKITLPQWNRSEVVRPGVAGMRA